MFDWANRPEWLNRLLGLERLGKDVLEPVEQRVLLASETGDAVTLRSLLDTSESGLVNSYNSQVT